MQEKTPNILLIAEIKKDLPLVKRPELLSTKLRSYQLLDFDWFSVGLGSVVSLLVPCYCRRKNECFS